AGGIGALFTMTQEVGEGQLLAAVLWNILLVIAAVVLYGLAGLVLLVSTNRSLFTERGYLTFALPVSTFEMLGSKLITNFAFMLLSVAEAAGLVYVAMTNMRRVVGKAAENLLDQANMAELKAMMSPEAMGLPSFKELMQFLGYALIEVVAVLIMVMMIFLFVLTISHVRPFQAKPGLWIPIFLVVTAAACFTIVHFVTLFFVYPITLGGLSRMLGGESPSINMYSPLTMLALSAALFFVTNYLLSKKISLK
ncbi:MAG: hypothetical protein LBB75_09155, partial [Oscillospiraceae bacterium]|nr:hypothetical protein [Oscillospiraceae bacterium]